MTKRFSDGMTCRTKALAYRMYTEAVPRSWDLTLQELADAIDEPLPRVRRVAQISGWLSRFRTTTVDRSHCNAVTERFDEDLDRLSVRA